MKIYFLGTNAWFDKDTNSSICTLIETKDKFLILDAGLGLVKATEIIANNPIKPVYLFLSHLHLDHIYGLHALLTLNLKSELKIFLAKENKVKLLNIFKHPYMMDYKEFPWSIKIIGLKKGEIDKAGLIIKTLPLKHIDYTVGYRLTVDKKIITYCCDTAPCRNDLLLAKNADVLIHECSLFTGVDKEWGHSGPEVVAEIAKKAQVKQLFLTHFSPTQYNSERQRRDAQLRAKKIFKPTKAVTDNLIVKI